MQPSKIYLSSPHISQASQDYVQEAFDQNWVAPLGPNVNEFEKAIEDYLGNKRHVASLSSGTAALHLALVQLGVEQGDTVICQSFTFAASANPIVYQGATPVFIDSEPHTWNMCPVHLETALADLESKDRKPKAIVVVHLYGMPAQMDEITSVARKYGIPIIEDSAEALGSSYKGNKCGTLGDFSMLSFNGNKIITTSGGGALVCPSRALKAKTVFLATQARDNAPHYEHSQIGYNYRLSNISAGIGRGQMEVLDERVAARRAMNLFYQEQFKDVEGVSVFKEPNSNFYSNHWLSAILIDETKTNGVSREDLRNAFETENIESRPLWKPMHLQPVFKGSLFYGETVCEGLFQNGLCLPSGSNLTDKDRTRIASVIKRTFVG
ncbi:aminotransferase class I/II-fold pyridoxal phosphate-dependent enzyme [Dokdonia sinensis]|uniref:GDP-perosamine synthase n=1 Tax=Dokdonia sinensis TaxID=2479847 RepID=A0A3M0GRK7_9FLAO|nr:aminotransferase class I/II-fold pyridoxal phosphate-dependent enzyme [Dokdonia sinensis]RMB63829.1 aminotransferase class I/II-fold pyridoxal phosphate-dependent enzyme [Dokdonia sinensis]